MKGDEHPLQHKEFICGYKPWGHKNPVCGGLPHDHRIDSDTVTTRSGGEVPQHNFMAMERGKDMGDAGSM